MNDNQFGFKHNHGTDMSVFLLKQVSSSYVSRDTPVFSVFLDASEAFIFFFTKKIKSLSLSLSF